ncbi:MAG: hypothetical protein J6N76_00235 [Lachnospiraceae bacterium]|nr:hypothetical protein [Lachnospiraceae bacterium]
MKVCPYCKMEVGGDLKKCPLCQSKLNGPDEEPYFPNQTALRIRSFFYKVQLFIVWTTIILCLGLDFLFHYNPLPRFNIHWSLLVFMWLGVFEFGIMRLFKKGTGSSRILTILVFILLIMLMITAYYLGSVWLMIEWVVPITIAGTMIANFVLAMLDNDGNSMVYLLSNLFVGVTPYVVFYVLQKDCPYTWIVCLLLSVILFVGAIIFKGREVISEIHRRFNM